MVFIKKKIKKLRTEKKIMLNLIMKKLKINKNPVDCHWILLFFSYFKKFPILGSGNNLPKGLNIESRFSALLISSG